MSIVKIVHEYSNLIQDDRSNAKIFHHMIDEVQELQEEIIKELSNQEFGEDGIFGECIDVISCALDLIVRSKPELSVEQLEKACNHYMKRKCEKWKQKSIIS